MPRTLLLICAAGPLLAVTYTPSDLGGSPTPIGAGARALGMGGAFAAIADDATANTWNPAGMTQLEQPEAALSGGWYARRTTFENGRTGTEGDLELDHLSWVQPLFTLGVQQSIGIAWQRQFDYTRGYGFNQVASSAPAIPTLTVDNDISFEQDGAFSSLSLSYAVELDPGFSIGITIHAWGDDITGSSSYDKAYTLDGRQTLSDPGIPLVFLDESIEERSSQSVELTCGYSAVAGLHWRLHPELTLAAVVKPRYRLHQEVRFSSSEIRRDLLTPGNPIVANTSTSGTRDQVTEFPTSATLAIGWRLDDLRTVTADLGWTRWSEYALLAGGSEVSPVSVFREPHEFDDGWSLRLGYEQHLILPRVVISPRFGLLYEGLSGVEAAPSVDRADEAEPIIEHWFGATAGISAFRRRVLYDLGLQLRYGSEVGSQVETQPDESVDIWQLTMRFGMTIQF